MVGLAQYTSTVPAGLGAGEILVILIVAHRRLLGLVALRLMPAASSAPTAPTSGGAAQSKRPHAAEIAAVPSPESVASPSATTPSKPAPVSAPSGSNSSFSSDATAEATSILSWDRSDKRELTRPRRAALANSSGAEQARTGG